MNKTSSAFYLFFVQVLLASCSNNSVKQSSSLANDNLSSIASEIDTNYVYTGFYFLTDEKGNGIKMKKEGTNETYLLERKPFASVANIERAELKTTRLE